ncbi:unnamed protein product [Pleuronectes platessa]|uniref:Uncharacterized protein n=1 Tax=Pleuronectes platessa TaxID=8262 RepID=A0A9N7Y6F9_PLEPL|nr:unnamed protein product [Pleuronectes platessa]
MTVVSSGNVVSALLGPSCQLRGRVRGGRSYEPPLPPPPPPPPPLSIPQVKVLQGVADVRSSQRYMTYYSSRPLVGLGASLMPAGSRMELPGAPLPFIPPENYTARTATGAVPHLVTSSPSGSHGRADRRPGHPWCPFARSPIPLREPLTHTQASRKNEPAMQKR